MNSLNESASIEMEVSPPPDAPCSPQNQTNEGGVSISQSYRSNLMNGDEKPLKMAAGNSNAGTSSYHNSCVQEPALSHTTTHTRHTAQREQNPTSSYHVPTNCPVTSTNNGNSTNINNAKYNFSSNQNQCPINGRLSPQSYAANQNGFPASNSQNQNSCPWKLSGGAKVLVRLVLFLFFSMQIFIPSLSIKIPNALLAVSHRHVHSIHVLWLRPVVPVRKCGSLSPNASPLLLKR